MRDPSPRAEFAAGAKAEVPVLFGVLPFGLIYGALALQAGIPPGAALAMSSVVLAGPGAVVRHPVFCAGGPWGPPLPAPVLPEFGGPLVHRALGPLPQPPGPRGERRAG